MALERMDVGNNEDRFQTKLHQMRYDFVLDRLPAGAKVLEIGTGEGIFTKQVLPKCESYIGVEFDPAACEEARRQAGPAAEIIVGDARNLPFGDNQFSFIVCLEVLEHLGDYQAGVRNIQRCLNTSGIAIASVPYRRVGGKSEVNPYHIYEPGEGELVSVFRQLFKDVEVHYLYFEETALMRFGRKTHLRRVLGLQRSYADLTAGLPSATARLRIGQKSGGMNISLLIVARMKLNR
jgi:ubiquinone/menaquinone biosynthesis C-methylase UbiE